MAETASAATNRLTCEPSLTLRQHGSYPVDRYPWRTGVLERSSVENRPILLSTDYSAAYVCRGQSRSAPIDGAGELLAQLRDS